MIPSNIKKQKSIVIVGPTAVGKTALSIVIAKAVGGEIVSADSRQVYTGLDIGSGKVTKEEMDGVPHHLLDVANPKETFTAADYIERGRKAIEDICSRGNMPIIVGGTGFYIDALLGRISLAGVPANETLRSKLHDTSLEELQNRLKKLDPDRFETIDTKNPVRLVRAIEIATKLGTVQKTNPQDANPEDGPRDLRPGDLLWIGLTLPMETLEERIAARLTVRLEKGMLEEAKQLHKEGLSYERMDELGLEYRSMARHLRGDISFDEMKERLQTEIRKYAKRQMTWFKRNRQINWMAPIDTEKALKLVKDFLN